MQSDVEFLEACLREGPMTNQQILGRAYLARGCGMTVHSRVADLRRKLRADGGDVSCTPVGRGHNGRPAYLYTLVEPSQQLELGAA